MRWSLLVAVLCASACLAGCSSPNPGPASSQTGTETFGAPVEVEGLVIASTHGAIRGTVHADTGSVIPGAHVLIIGADHAADTDDKGTFLFTNVSVGPQRLRIEATGYRFYEGEVDVEASKVVEVHPTLIPLDAGDGDYRAHIHDYWGSDTEITIVDRTYAIDEFRVHSTTAEAYPELNFVSATVLYANTVFAGLRYRIPLAEDANRPPLVYGGGDRVEVSFTWNNAPPGVPSYSFGYETALSSDVVILEPHGPGVPWTVDVTPEMADNGHQSLSLWSFYVVPVNNAQSAPNYRPAVAVDPIHVKITVYKGTDPTPEPAHPEFWTAGDRWAVRDETAEVQTAGANVWAFGNFRAIKIVPPGTKWLEVDFLWRYTDAVPVTPVPPDYDLYYNPGNVHWDRFTTDYKLQEDAETIAPGHLRYNITLQPGEADGFYQFKTLWYFRIRNADNTAGEDGLPDDFYRTRSYQLLVTAIKDPEVGLR